jgi:predicted phosphodiesterase
MRLAVISDIQGNLLALEQVLADIEALGEVDLTWCLGDLAALGPRPAECIERIKALAEADEGKRFKVIGGNTERYVVNGERLRSPSAADEAAFQALAGNLKQRDAAFNWVLERISFAEHEFLKQIRGRELSHKVEGFGHVIGYHGVPGDDEVFLNPDCTDEELMDSLLDQEGRLAVCGHTHRPFDRQVGGWRVINVGSVGMPFDAPGVSSWCLLTFEGNTVQVELRRIPFDVEAVLADCHAVGFPSVEWLATRLRGS